MPHYVFAIDGLGILMAVAGFFLSFRQTLVRHIFNLPNPGEAMVDGADDAPDAFTYIMRLSGVMMMVFGLAIASMFTLFNLAGTGTIH